MAINYQLSPSAKEDLDKIIDYTIERFGLNQTRTYIATLDKCMTKLADGKTGRNFPDIDLDLPYTKCEHHYIFGIPQIDAPFYVIAIFHEKMDLINRVADRL